MQRIRNEVDILRGDAPGVTWLAPVIFVAVVAGFLLSLYLIAAVSGHDLVWGTSSGDDPNTCPMYRGC